MAIACELTPRFEKLEAKMESLEKSFNDYRIESVEQLTKIEERQSITYKATEDIKVEIKTMNKSLDEDKATPNNSKAALFDKVVWMIIAAIIGFVLAKIGLSV